MIGSSRRVAAFLSQAGTIMKSKRSTALASVLLTAFGCAVERTDLAAAR
jgi:hypothetical protein